MTLLRDARRRRAAGGARAARAGATSVDAIWLPGDTDVITPQVFQYALRLQLERGLPVAAATRQQVHSGALIAVDFSPRAAGRAAADLANRCSTGARRRTRPSSTSTAARA